MRLIHSFRVLGACLSCLQVYKEALNIDVSYKKAVFRAFFCFLFPLQEGRRIFYLFTFHPTFFFYYVFSLFLHFFFYPFSHFLFYVIDISFSSSSFLLSSFVCLQCSVLYFCSVVFPYKTIKLFNYRCFFSFSLHRLICVYIIYIYQCICVYINRDIHYTYYIRYTRNILLS